jgi:pimeloyl-ACP methyl ester carboxylesterase
LALRSFSNGALFAEVFGDGPAQVLALHGWGRRGSDFAKSLGDIPAIAPDLPGFGASPPPSEIIGADEYADMIVEILDFFDEPPVLVGHSFGGRVAVCLAARHPDRVGPLVLTGVPLIRHGSTRRPQFGYRVIRWANSIGLVSDERIEREKKRRGSADYRNADGVMRDILVKVVNESYEEQLRHIETPVTLLWGEDDTEVPVAVAEAASVLLADSELVVLVGVGHFVPVEAPDVLRRAVVEAMG